MGLGIKTDVIIIRSSGNITDSIKDKISLFCDVPNEAIIQSYNVDLIYEVPLSFKKQGLDSYILKKLKLEEKPQVNNHWEEMINKFKSADKEVDIALVGKYVKLHDAYLSVAQALFDAG